MVVPQQLHQLTPIKKIRLLRELRVNLLVLEQILLPGLKLLILKQQLYEIVHKKKKRKLINLKLDYSLRSLVIDLWRLKLLIPSQVERSIRPTLDLFMLLGVSLAGLIMVLCIIRFNGIRIPQVSYITCKPCRTWLWSFIA